MPVASADQLHARRRKFNLFVAFAFTIMADPVSSVAYAMEAALGALDGDLSSLFPTMAVVVVIIALVAAGYDGLIARFPNGGGGPGAIAQLGQLDERGRRRFGQLTVWLMLVIVGALTLVLAALAVRLGLGEPATDSTLLADVARAATGTLAAALVLVLNLRRLDPVVSLAAAAAVSLYLWRTWVARGRPAGVARIAA